MRAKVIFLISFVCLLTLGLSIYAPHIDRLAQNNPWLARFISYSSPGSDDGSDLAADQGTLERVYVTITGNDPVHGLSFQGMNRLGQTDSLAMEPSLPAVFLAGDPERFDAQAEEGETVPNATIEQRGYSARIADQKSYKIRLQPGTLWHNQEVLNLNKHAFDYTRVRNKLSYDLLRLIPDLVSMDTRFVQLFVKDTTNPPQPGQFVDYGLFTHVEQPNRDFLKRVGLDPDGYLYKAVQFEFYRYPELLRNRSDPLYDKAAFETVLGISGREYHEKLIAMLEEVNDESKDFDEVFHKHFDQDNFLTWIAVNLIMGNLDTTGNNFYLYSSRFTDKWYFLPWDYDKAWNFDWQWGYDAAGIHPAREGLSLYWGWPLARRFFENPDHVEALNEKMAELSQIITEKRTRALLEEYYPVVKPMATRLPDVQLLPEDIERFDEEYYALAKFPAQSLEKYYANLEKPMPVFMGGPWFEADRMTFTWGQSFDLQGDELFYDLQISTAPDFSNVVREYGGLQVYEMTMEPLDPGVYYWRIIVRDSKGHEQVAFESFIDDELRFYHGVKQFTLE